jgi:hypothetical protein
MATGFVFAIATGQQSVLFVVRFADNMPEWHTEVIAIRQETG